MKTAVLEKNARRKEAKHPHALIRRIQRGLRFRELEDLQNKIDIPMEQLAEQLSISRSTLQRRKLVGPLSAEESDKVIRVARLFRLAPGVIGDLGKARGWLKHRQ